MRRTHIALTLIGLLAVGACSARDATVQRELTPTSPLASKPGSGGSCDFTLITNDAKTFVATGNDPVFGLISSMQTYYAAQDYPDATNSGWDIQARIAAARLTSAQQGTAADGFKLSYDVFQCMVVSTNPLGTIQIPPDYIANGTLALQEGVFEVRGGALDNTGPAAAYLKNVTRVLTSPRWGVEGTWPALGRYLVYGYPSTLAAILNGAPTINQNSLTPPTPAYNAINLGTVPAGVEHNAGLTVGICGVPTAGSGQVVTLTHFRGSATVLSAVTPTSLCTFTPPTFTLAPMQSMTRALASLFAVTPAYAMQGEFDIGGLPSDWSPFTSGQSNSGDFTLAFQNGPSNKFTSQQESFDVYATTKDKDGNVVPAEGVVVTVTIAGNNGVPATFDGASSLTGTTNSSGIASFSTKITKAGGYTISASGTLASGATTSVTSPMFWIKNK